MNEYREIDGGGYVALGRLEELASFKDRRPRMADGLPDDIPVLTFPLRASEACRLGSSFQKANFGFGHMEIEDGLLMTMRLQLQGVQFYWLAEMTDPELWAAIDRWRSVGRVPFGLQIERGNKWDMKLGALNISPGRLTSEKYRAAPPRLVAAHDLHSMARLVTGFIQRHATTDIPGIPLEHVFASVLLTKQFEAVARGY
jgi:hypothetical protein